jgi:hypothetical protein
VNIPTVAPHRLQPNRELSGHGHLGDAFLSRHRQVRIPPPPVRITTHHACSLEFAGISSLAKTQSSTVDRVGLAKDRVVGQDSCRMTRVFHDDWSQPWCDISIVFVETAQMGHCNCPGGDRKNLVRSSSHFVLCLPS